MVCTGTTSVTKTESGLSATLTEIIHMDTTWTTNNSFGGQLEAEFSCTGDCWVVEALLSITFPCTTTATMEATQL
jgi:hypothetical protein